jgi:hypothetical protein
MPPVTPACLCVYVVSACPVCRCAVNDPASIIEFGCVAGVGEGGDAGGDALGGQADNYIPLPKIRGADPSEPTATVVDVLGNKFQVTLPVQDAYIRTRGADGAKISALLQGLRAMFRGSSTEKAIGASPCTSRSLFARLFIFLCYQVKVNDSRFDLTFDFVCDSQLLISSLVVVVCVYVQVRKCARMCVCVCVCSCVCDQCSRNSLACLTASWRPSSAKRLSLCTFTAA